MKSMLVAFALSGAAVASALGSGSALQVPSLPTGGDPILETSEIPALHRRHLTSQGEPRRERGMEHRERDTDRQERTTDRQDRGTDRRERGMERRERGTDRRERGMERGEEHGDADGGRDPGPEGPPIPDPGRAPGPAGPPIPGPGRAPGPAGPPIPGPGRAPGPAGSPIPGPGRAPVPAGPPIPGPGGAPGPATPNDNRSPNELQDGPSIAGLHGPFSAADNSGNRDGEVSLEEINVFVADNRERQIGLIAFFHESDLNGDDVMDADELAVIDPLGAFDGSDEDSSGTITLEEITVYSNAPGRSYRVIGVKAFFELADLNDDDLVDTDELQAAHDSGLLEWN